MSNARSIMIGIVNYLGIRVEVEAGGEQVEVKKCRCFSLSDRRVSFNYTSHNHGAVLVISLQGSEIMSATLPPQQLKLIPTPHTSFEIDLTMPMQLVLGDQPTSGPEAVGCGEGGTPPIE